METKKNFKVGDTVKCIKDNLVFAFEPCSPSSMFLPNQEYIIEKMTTSGCICVRNSSYAHDPKHFVKVLKTAKDKALLLDYLKSTYQSFNSCDYIFDVENAQVNFESGLITYDLITKSHKPSPIFPEVDWKTVHKSYNTWLDRLETFEQAQKKVHDDVQAQIFNERKAERITQMGKEIMAEILKQDKFASIYTVDITENQEEIAKQLFLYFTEHKPQELKTIIGIEKLVSSENNYRCVLVGIPYDTKGGDAGSMLKMYRSVSKKYLEFFLNSKIEPSRPALGLVPIEIRERDFKIKRFNEVCSAISRRYDANENIPIKWIEEYNSLAVYIKNETKQGV